MSSSKLDCYQQQFSSIFREKEKEIKYQLSNKKKRIHIFQMNSFFRTEHSAEQQMREKHCSYDLLWHLNWIMPV